MKGSILRGFAVLSLSLLLPLPMQADDQDATAIARDVDERFARACNAGNLPTLTSMYVDDATVIFPPEPAIGRDAAAVEAMLRRNCDPASGVSYRPDAIRGRYIGEDHISVVGEWTITAPGDDGKPTDVPARATAILVRTDGGWKYLTDHASAAPPSPE